MKGFFITFEGSEGSGKSTQSHLLAGYLRRKGCRVVYLREPGGTAISEKVRTILLDTSNGGMSARCETLLYMAARAQLVEKVIHPALKTGKIVICDRFLDSTLAYQGYGLGIDIKAIRSIGAFATFGIKPDLTLFMDLPVRCGLRHRHGRKDRIEKRSCSYHERVRRGYLTIARREPERLRVVRVDDDPAVTQQRIREIVASLIRRS